MDSPYPILRLELEHMRRTIAVTLSECVINMDKDIQDAISKVITDENLRVTVCQSVVRAVNSVIAEEVDRFFKYDDGRSMIRDFVKRILSEEE